MLVDNQLIKYILFKVQINHIDNIQTNHIELLNYNKNSK